MDSKKEKNRKIKMKLVQKKADRNRKCENDIIQNSE